MKTNTFHRLLDNVKQLNTLQYRELKELIENIDSINHVSRDLETPYDDLKCPYCECKEKLRWGKRNDLQRYKCKACKRTYNSLTGSSLSKLRKKGRWLMYSECLKEGFSVRKSAKICGVHKSTTFRWRHRFLNPVNKIKPVSLNGIVEAEERFFPYSEKGKRRDKYESKNEKQTVKKIPRCVFIGRDRNNNTFDDMLTKFSNSCLNQSISSLITKDSLFCSSSNNVYREFTKNAGIRHGFLDISKGENVKKDIVHLRNVNSYYNGLLKWMTRFHGVATKYLSNYLSWYRELDEFNMNISPRVILLRAKSGGNYIVNHKR